jgi:ATP-dependent Clp protease adapter protein ClpS
MYPSRRFVTENSATSSAGLLRQYKLILHRSAEAALPAVVRAVRDVTRFAEAEATRRMWVAYYRGRAVVLTTHLERAEFLAERFAELGLQTSLEPE